MVSEKYKCQKYNSWKCVNNLYFCLGSGGEIRSQSKFYIILFLHNITIIHGGPHHE